jgi:sortase (surface protein transpeptidase)
VISRTSTAGVACYSLSGAHIVCDIMGWFTGTPQPASTTPPIDPPPPPGPLPWTLQVPRMGLGHGVFEGRADPIVDSGNSWHWTGTGLVGQKANIVTFGHRTSAGGPYRYQHNLLGGDLLYVTTSDRRIYTYKMAAEYLTSKYTNDILAATRRLGGETFALVACTGDKNGPVLNRLPGGSTQWRIVSVFTLVEWADLG